MRPVDIQQSARPGIVLLVSLVGCTLIGRHYGEPIVGLAVGIGLASLINGVRDYQLEQQQSSQVSA